MKHTLLIAAATLALAGCSKANDSDEATAPAAATTSAMAAAAPTAAATAPVAAPGTYQITEADGKVTSEMIMADGTFTDSRDGKQTDSGTWRVDGTKSCFTSKGKSEMCMTTGPAGADGSFPVIGPDGKQTATVKKTA